MPNSIGESAALFSYIQSEGWSDNSDFENIKARSANKAEPYVLVEYGSVNFKDYHFFLLELETGQLVTNEKSNHGVLKVPKDKVAKISSELSVLTEASCIYDGTSAADDGNIYFVTVSQGGTIYRFGSYSLILGSTYESDTEKQIAKSNIRIISGLLDALQLE